MPETLMVKSVHLELSSFCNLSCTMCPNSKMRRTKSFLPFHLIKKIARENPQIQDYGLNNWGESLLHPDFLRIVSFLKERKKTIGFATNGTLLTFKYARRLIDLNVDKITFSLDSIGKHYTEIRHFPYETVRKNIKQFLLIREKMGKEKQISASILATVFKENEPFIRILKNEWKPFVNVRLQPMLTFQPDFRKNTCNQIHDKHLVVLSDGSVVPCCADYEGFAKMGNAYAHSLNEIFNSKEFSKFREKGTSKACYLCSEYKSSLTVERFKINPLVQRAQRGLIQLKGLVSMS